MKFILAVLFFSLFSCSIINPREQEVYKSKREMRHGIIPIVNNENIKNIVKTKVDPASSSRGKILYEKNCLSCHGVNGLGDGPRALENEMGTPANLKKMAQEVEDFDFFISVSNWKQKMPGWKNPLTEFQRRDITNYLKTFRD